MVTEILNAVRMSVTICMSPSRQLGLTGTIVTCYISGFGGEDDNMYVCLFLACYYSCNCLEHYPGGRGGGRIIFCCCLTKWVGEL